MFNDLLTKSEIDFLCRRVWNQNVIILEHRIQPYSDQKLGFTSTHFSVQLKVQDPSTNDIKVTKLFMKFKPKDAMQDVVEEMEIFEKETVIYNQIFPLLEKNCVEFFGPTCFLADEEKLVLQDLGLEGFSLVDKILTEDQLKAALKSLARMHAASLLTEEQVGRLDAIFPQAFHSKYFEYGKFRHWVSCGIDLGVAIAEKMGLNGSSFRKLVEDNWKKGLGPCGNFNVFCHADLWSNNLMFCGDKCILVDFQLVRYAPPIHDVFFLLYLCCTEELREEHEKSLVTFYYEALRESMEKSGQSCPIDWFKLTEGKEEYRFTAAVMAMLYKPTTIIIGTKLSALTKTEDEMMKFTFEDRVDVILGLMDEDKVYADKLMRAVREVFELGEKMKMK